MQDPVAAVQTTQWTWILPTLWGWVCGGTGTNVPLKYLPGSCRG